MTDENFQRMHASVGSGIVDLFLWYSCVRGSYETLYDDDLGNDLALQWIPEREHCTLEGGAVRDGASWREQTLDDLLSTLFRSLGPHRGERILIFSYCS
jgi:hypothetical protein